MWKNTCNGGRLCYRKVKITSNSATEATTHTDESNDYVAWYDKATGTLYLKCYQGGKIVTACYDNTTGYELRGIGCGGVLSIAESAKVDVNVTGGTPKGVYVANGLTTSDSMTLTVTTAVASGDGICGHNSNTSGTCNINLAGGTTTNTKSGEDKADVKINGGKLNISNTTSSGRSAGIYSANNRIAVSSGTVEIVDNSFAMDLLNGTVDISGNAKVNLTVNSDNHGAVATNSDSTIHLSEGGRAT